MLHLLTSIGEKTNAVDMKIVTADKPNIAVAHTTGDIKEAIERTREAEAYQREALVRRFGGDKVAAEEYARAKARRRGQRV